MNDFYQRWKALDLDKSTVGLDAGEYEEPWFCTPLGAEIIGWEAEGVHYCFAPGYGEQVMAVNPMPAGEDNVYPLADSFEDFLRLLLSCTCTAVIEQIIWMTEEQFRENLKDERAQMDPEQEELLERIGTEFHLTPIDDPYHYVKGVQARFCPDKLRFSDEYYDVKGLPFPSGAEKIADYGFREEKADIYQAAP